MTKNWNEMTDSEKLQAIDYDLADMNRKIVCDMKLQQVSDFLDLKINQLKALINQ